jgi:phosphonopyruvate decarboxylase
MKCEDLWEIFKKENITFFSGVPDSTFKDWMKLLNDKHGIGLTNIIACNECEAIATITGHHLATKNIGVAYMQNSGLGKTINPLTSLCDKEVYSIPLILMVGWRGKPGEKDEPQHKKMGEITLSLLDILNIPYRILPKDVSKAKDIIIEMKNKTLETNSPVALIISKGIFEEYQFEKDIKTNYEMNREEAIKIITNELNEKDIIISTTGKTSRELFEHRIEKKELPRDFYTVGSMGCSASIANGIALQKPGKNIFIFDGDGAIIMQMGSLATIGSYKSKNLYHIIFDNSSYDSTGGQPSNSSHLSFEEIALSCGYKATQTIKTKEELVYSIRKLKEKKGPQLLVIKVNKGARKDLGRPTTTPIENKKTFMDFLDETN